MTVDEVYQLISYIVAKNKEQGYLSPADFNLTINQAQRSYTDYLLGEYQKYQIRRPIAVVEFGQNERIRESISPLIYNITFLPNSTTGIASFPSDYEYTDNMWDLYNLYNIKFIQQDRQSAYTRSVIDPVQTNPVYLINHEGFLFFPHDIGWVNMSYVRIPPPITWGYDLDGNGIPVYNPALSQQPVWGVTDMLNIIVRALQIVGVNLQLNDAIQYSQEIKNAGQ